MIYQFRISLRDVKPAIWRQFQIHSESSIEDLHHLVQIVMGWEDMHLNRFIIDDKEYGIAQSGGIFFEDDPKEVKLSDFGLRVRDSLYYEYDFGDLWQHDIRLEKKLNLDAKKSFPQRIAG